MATGFVPANPPIIVVEQVGGGGTTSPLTTKGDLFGFDTTNNRVPVGTNGFILTADSAQTTGLGWSTRDVNHNNFNILNAAGLLTGTTTWPTVINPGGNTNLLRPVIATNGNYTATYGASNNFYTPVVINDTINVAASGAAAGNPECAALAVRGTFTFSDGRASEVCTGLDIGTVSAGTNTLIEQYGIGAGVVVGANTTSVWGCSISIQAAATVTNATAFRGLVTLAGGTIQNVVGLSLLTLATGTTSTWAMQVGNWPSYHQGSLLLNATTFPTATTGGNSLQANGALVSNGSPSVAFSASGKTFIDWLLNDTITFSGNQATSNIYGLGLYPKFVASQGRTDETAAGLACSPSFTGTDTYSTIYGLILSASVTSSATTAVGVQSNVVVSGGTTTTMTGFKFAPVVFGGTVTTTVGLDLTSLAGSTIWGMKVGNYQSFHQGAVAFGAAAAPVYGVDLQALNSGSLSVIGVAGTSSTPAAPGSNKSWWGLWFGGTNYYFVVAFNDTGTMRFTSLGPLNGAGAASLSKGTSLPV